MSVRRLVPLVVLLLAGCHSRPAPEAPRLHGIRVDARSAEGLRAEGELLAVSRDSLWVMDAAVPHAVIALPLLDIEVRPVGGGQLRPQLWATIGGGLTGVGMLIACASYEGEAACVGMIPLMLAMYHGVGLAAWLAMAVDRPDRLDPEPEHLRRFARFPAGLPRGFSGR